MKIGFTGLGIRGTPMALHLIDAGHQLYVKTRSALPAAITAIDARMAVPCASAADVAREAEVMFLMLPDTPDVQAVLFGEAGVAAGLGDLNAVTPVTPPTPPNARKVVVDMSSISPMATKTFAQRINALGADCIDAPVSGGEVGAKAASLTVMCGGDAAVSSVCCRCCS